MTAVAVWRMRMPASAVSTLHNIATHCTRMSMRKHYDDWTTQIPS